MPTSSTLDVLPQLDDNDVNLLYEIVYLAQQSGGRPIRALFDACEGILQQGHADPEHHSRCFRFLFHASTDLARDGTSGLLKRFRALLASAGIQLQLEGEEDVSVRELPDIQDIPGPGLEHAVQSELGQRERRRASFNDSNLDTTWISGDRIVPDGALENARSRQSSHDIVQSNFVPKSRRARSTSLIRENERRHPYRLPQQASVEAQVDFHALSEDAESFRYNILAKRYLWLWETKTIQTQQRRQDLLQLAQNHDRRILLKQSFAQLRDAVFDTRYWTQQSRRAGRARDLFLLTKAFTHWAQTTSDEIARTNVAKRHILRTRYFNAWRDITAVNELKCRRVGLRKWFSVWKSKTDTRLSGSAQAISFRDHTLVERTYKTWFWTLCERKAPIWKDSRLKIATLEKLRSACANRTSSNLAADGVRNRALQLDILRKIQNRVSSYSNDEATAAEHRRRHMLSAAFKSVCRRVQFDPRVLQLRRASCKRLQRNALLLWSNAASDARIARQVDQKRILNNAWTTWNDHLRSRTLQIRIDDRVLIQSLYKWVLEERLVLFRRVIDHRQKAAAIQRLNTRLAERRFQLNEATQIFTHNLRTRLMRTALARMHQLSRQYEHNELAAIEFRNARDVPAAFNLWKTRCSDVIQLTRHATQARYYCLASPSIKAWKEATVNAQKRRRREAYAVIRRKIKMNLARRCLEIMLAKVAGCQALQMRSTQMLIDKRLAVCRQYFDIWHAQSDHWQMESSRAEARAAQDRLRDALDAMIFRRAAVMELESQAALIVKDSQDNAAGRMFRKLSDNLFVLRRQSETAQAWHDRKFAQHSKEMIRYWATRASERRTIRIAGDPDSPSKTPMLRASRNSRRGLDTSFDFGSTFRVGELPEYGVGVDATGVSDMSFGASLLPGYLRTPSRRTGRTRARFKSIPERAVGAALPSTNSGILDFGSSVIGSTTPAPLVPGSIVDLEILTPQVTPFQRKLRAGGYAESTTPASIPQNVRAGNRFGTSSRLRDTGRTVRFGDVVEEKESVVGEGTENSPSRR
ncbi:Sfi1-domain-containing protein [Myriangium duriaei CBS 260.36]|uniref:Sfi1-domain-containing protein n=1 Tax=Myriangium duriaei CBS 260.36 TaxID=1168546 RepID=A0A9P4IYU9_9PEZI|nr:Sfi1-domain-containing protein [Myriangium duriaei CBS 260.36]